MEQWLTRSGELELPPPFPPGAMLRAGMEGTHFAERFVWLCESREDWLLRVLETWHVSQRIWQQSVLAGSRGIGWEMDCGVPPNQIFIFKKVSLSLIEPPE